MNQLVASEIQSYCQTHTTAPGELLEELERYTREHCQYAGMMVGAIEGQFLKLLVQLANARCVLEIGTFTGYSALSMAEALPENGTLITCEIDPVTAGIAQKFFKRSIYGQKIDIRVGPALQTIRELPPETELDVVFIDADKENYVEYYEAVMPRVRDNGLIVADNVLWSGRVLDPQEDTDRALVRFNTHVRNDKRVECVLLAVRDGITLIRKR